MPTDALSFLPSSPPAPRALPLSREEELQKSSSSSSLVACGRSNTTPVFLPSTSPSPAPPPPPPPFSSHAPSSLSYASPTSSSYQQRDLYSHRHPNTTTTATTTTAAHPSLHNSHTSSSSSSPSLYRRRYSSRVSSHFSSSSSHRSQTRRGERAGTIYEKSSVSSGSRRSYHPPRQSQLLSIPSHMTHPNPPTSPNSHLNTYPHFSSSSALLALSTHAPNPSYPPQLPYHSQHHRDSVFDRTRQPADLPNYAPAAPHHPLHRLDSHSSRLLLLPSSSSSSSSSQSTDAPPSHGDLTASLLSRQHLSPSATTATLPDASRHQYDSYHYYSPPHNPYQHYSKTAPRGGGGGRGRGHMNRHQGFSMPRREDLSQYSHPSHYPQSYPNHQELHRGGRASVMTFFRPVKKDNPQTDDHHRTPPQSSTKKNIHSSHRSYNSRLEQENSSSSFSIGGDERFSFPALASSYREEKKEEREPLSFVERGLDGGPVDERTRSRSPSKLMTTAPSSPEEGTTEGGGEEEETNKMEKKQERRRRQEISLGIDRYAEGVLPSAPPQIYDRRNAEGNSTDMNNHRRSPASSSSPRSSRRNMESRGSFHLQQSHSVPLASQIAFYNNGPSIYPADAAFLPSSSSSSSMPPPPPPPSFASSSSSTSSHPFSSSCCPLPPPSSLTVGNPFISRKTFPPLTRSFISPPYIASSASSLGQDSLDGAFSHSSLSSSSASPPQIPSSSSYPFSTSLPLHRTSVSLYPPPSHPSSLLQTMKRSDASSSSCILPSSSPFSVPSSSSSFSSSFSSSSSFSASAIPNVPQAPLPPPPLHPASLNLLPSLDQTVRQLGFNRSSSHEEEERKERERHLSLPPSVSFSSSGDSSGRPPYMMKASATLADSSSGLSDEGSYGQGLFILPSSSPFNPPYLPHMYESCSSSCSEEHHPGYETYPSSSSSSSLFAYPLLDQNNSTGAAASIPSFQSPLYPPGVNEVSASSSSTFIENPATSYVSHDGYAPPSQQGRLDQEDAKEYSSYLPSLRSSPSFSASSWMNQGVHSCAGSSTGSENPYSSSYQGALSANVFSSSSAEGQLLPNGLWIPPPSSSAFTSPPHEVATSSSFYPSMLPAPALASSSLTDRRETFVSGGYQEESIETRGEGGEARPSTRDIEGGGGRPGDPYAFDERTRNNADDDEDCKYERRTLDRSGGRSYSDTLFQEESGENRGRDDDKTGQQKAIRLSEGGRSSGYRLQLLAQLERMKKEKKTGKDDKDDGKEFRSEGAHEGDELQKKEEYLYIDKKEVKEQEMNSFGGGQLIPGKEKEQKDEDEKEKGRHAAKTPGGEGGEERNEFQNDGQRDRHDQADFPGVYTPYLGGGNGNHSSSTIGRRTFHPSTNQQFLSSVRDQNAPSLNYGIFPSGDYHPFFLSSSSSPSVPLLLSTSSSVLYHPQPYNACSPLPQDPSFSSSPPPLFSSSSSSVFIPPQTARVAEMALSSSVSESTYLSHPHHTSREEQEKAITRGERRDHGDLELGGEGPKRRPEGDYYSYSYRHDEENSLTPGLGEDSSLPQREHLRTRLSRRRRRGGRASKWRQHPRYLSDLPKEPLYASACACLLRYMECPWCRSSRATVPEDLRHSKEEEEDEEEEGRRREVGDEKGEKNNNTAPTNEDKAHRASHREHGEWRRSRQQQRRPGEDEDEEEQTSGRRGRRKVLRNKKGSKRGGHRGQSFTRGDKAEEDRLSFRDDDSDTKEKGEQTKKKKTTDQPDDRDPPPSTPLSSLPLASPHEEAPLILGKKKRGSGSGRKKRSVKKSLSSLSPSSYNRPTLDTNDRPRLPPQTTREDSHALTLNKGERNSLSFSSSSSLPSEDRLIASSHQDPANEDGHEEERARLGLIQDISMKNSAIEDTTRLSKSSQDEMSAEKRISPPLAAEEEPLGPSLPKSRMDRKPPSLVKDRNRRGRGSRDFIPIPGEEDERLPKTTNRTPPTDAVGIALQKECPGLGSSKSSHSNDSTAFHRRKSPSSSNHDTNSSSFSNPTNYSSRYSSTSSTGGDRSSLDTVTAESSSNPFIGSLLKMLNKKKEQTMPEKPLESDGRRVTESSSPDPTLAVGSCATKEASTGIDPKRVESSSVDSLRLDTPVVMESLGMNRSEETRHCHDGDKISDRRIVPDDDQRPPPFARSPSSQEGVMMISSTREELLKKNEKKKQNNDNGLLGGRAEEKKGGPPTQSSVSIERRGGNAFCDDTKSKPDESERSPSTTRQPPAPPPLSYAAAAAKATTLVLPLRKTDTAIISNIRKIPLSSSAAQQPLSNSLSPHPNKAITTPVKTKNNSTLRKEEEMASVTPPHNRDDDNGKKKKKTHSNNNDNNNNLPDPDICSTSTTRHSSGGHSAAPLTSSHVLLEDVNRRLMRHQGTLSSSSSSPPVPRSPRKAGSSKTGGFQRGEATEAAVSVTRTQVDESEKKEEEKEKKKEEEGSCSSSSASSSSFQVDKDLQKGGSREELQKKKQWKSKSEVLETDGSHTRNPTRRRPTGTRGAAVAFTTGEGEKDCEENVIKRKKKEEEEEGKECAERGQSCFSGVEKNTTHPQSEGKDRNEDLSSCHREGLLNERKDETPAIFPGNDVLPALVPEANATTSREVLPSSSMIATETVASSPPPLPPSCSSLYLHKRSPSIPPSSTPPVASICPQQPSVSSSSSSCSPLPLPDHSSSPAPHPITTSGRSSFTSPSLPLPLPHPPPPPPPSSSSSSSRSLLPSPPPPPPPSSPRFLPPTTASSPAFVATGEAEGERKASSSSSSHTSLPQHERMTRNTRGGGRGGRSRYHSMHSQRGYYHREEEALKPSHLAYRVSPSSSGSSSSSSSSHRWFENTPPRNSGYHHHSSYKTDSSPCHPYPASTPPYGSDASMATSFSQRKGWSLVGGKKERPDGEGLRREEVQGDDDDEDSLNAPVKHAGVSVLPFPQKTRAQDQEREGGKVDHHIPHSQSAPSDRLLHFSSLSTTPRSRRRSSSRSHHHHRAPPPKTSSIHTPRQKSSQSPSSTSSFPPPPPPEMGSSTPSNNSRRVLNLLRETVHRSPPADVNGVSSPVSSPRLHKEDQLLLPHGRLDETSPPRTPMNTYTGSAQRMKKNNDRNISRRPRHYRNSYNAQHHHSQATPGGGRGTDLGGDGRILHHHHHHPSYASAPVSSSSRVTQERTPTAPSRAHDDTRQRETAQHPAVQSSSERVEQTEGFVYSPCSSSQKRRNRGGSRGLRARGRGGGAASHWTPSPFSF